ncbi:MAG TPA: alkaline phosphatase family protein [Thermoanaerobaculia bacterium]|nr:alkaline phosphatase family protein [Thermoanaerobaculia bacterium]
MRKTVVINVAGLGADQVGESTPNLSRLARAGVMRPLDTIIPAVTCSVQATFTTGTLPRKHGCVGNGWYDRDLSEVLFWKQSNRLVRGEKIWDAARRIDPGFTCAKMFWWYNMYSSADIAVTPRPMYLADGRKIPDIYTHPPELREELSSRFGTFPLFHFWGPTADITSSRWIADATMDVIDRYDPTLTLVYLPHLDYNLQRLGPADPAIRNDLRAIDAICGDLLEQASRRDAAVVVLSEYSVETVDRPVHINRVLREAGLLRTRLELGRELLDPGASEAFAVADHQVAHVYVRDHRRIGEIAALLERTPGIDTVLSEEGKRDAGLDHPRSGELVAVAAQGAWFTYYYWLDDDRAPDFARTVDIHRKPGYDPVELFVDPDLRLPKAQIAWKLARRKLGFRSLLDVIPLRPELVGGSHGRAVDPEVGPLFISSDPVLPLGDTVAAAEVKDRILDLIFADELRQSSPRLRASTATSMTGVR